MPSSKLAGPVIILLAFSLASCEASGPLQPEPPDIYPSFSLVGYVDPFIAEADAATLSGLLNIDFADVEVSGVGGYDPWFKIETEATCHFFTPAGPLLPRTRHDAALVMTVNHDTQPIFPYPSDYELTDGYRVNYHTFSTPRCDDVFQLEVEVATQHFARWTYWLVLPYPLVNSFMSIDEGPVFRTASDGCSVSGPVAGGGWIEPGEGECQLCQEWFYFVDGIQVDHWWECTPIDGSYCEQVT